LTVNRCDAFTSRFIVAEFPARSPSKKSTRLLAFGSADEAGSDELGRKEKGKKVEN
jgi:hypothetical protein